MLVRVDGDALPGGRRTTERTILVVDDEPIIRDLCARALKEFRVIQAESGAVALERLLREPCDVVLVDVMMPNMNGLDLLRAIKERAPNQVVVVMTGYADKDVILRALKANADDFISKPINLLQLRTTIDKVLEKQALREELVQIRRMDRLKSDFLGLVSHKLKTPTTGISLFFQNLAAGVVDPASPDFRQVLAQVQAEARYLDYLIKDLLYYSEFILQEEPARPELQSLGELLREVVAELERDLRNRSLDLRCALPPELPRLEFDRKRIGFVLRALLENAIKFTPPGGQIRIRAEAGEDDVRLSVADSGPGIAAEELPKVFDKFYQVDPHHTGQVRGFGLGLYYARLFVQSHRGSLQLDSKPGAGTVATMTLPRP